MQNIIALTIVRGLLKSTANHAHVANRNPSCSFRPQKKHRIDLKASFMVGDRFSDIVAGNSVNCKTIFVLTGHGMDEVSHLKGSSVPVAVNLLNEVKEYII